MDGERERTKTTGILSECYSGERSERGTAKQGGEKGGGGGGRTLSTSFRTHTGKGDSRRRRRRRSSSILTYRLHQQ